MKKFSGIFTALITPMKNGLVDEASLGRLVDHQLKNGVNGFVINGTTAESPTLTATDRENVFKFVRSKVGSQFPLVMGTGSISTAKTIEDSKKAEALGANGILVVVPYYNKPPQRGLVAHFNAVANSVNIPTILYNVPGRTITALSLESIVELSKNPKIIGIKEASGNIEFAKQIRQSCGPEFCLLSGDDGTFVEFMAAGGNGVISVTSHVFPSQMVTWYQQCLSGKTEEARKGIHQFDHLTNLMFSEANPIPVKKALQMMRILESAELRLPLVELAPEWTEKIKIEMHERGILS